MLTRFHKHFGPAGLIVAIVALVAALAGGAIAAGGGSDGKATTSAKAKQGPRGPKGPKGATGAAGPAGPQGAKGDPGAAGATGTNGTAGANGASVTSTKLNPGNANCVAGGSQFKAGGGAPTYACNGEEGAEGAPGADGTEGSPWTAGGTLPPGKSETGTWSVGPSGLETPLETWSPISFFIPLANAGDEENEAEEIINKIPVIYMNSGSSPDARCPGTIAEPAAAPGNLCVFARKDFDTEFVQEKNPEANTTEGGTGKTGVLLQFRLNTKAAVAQGIWVLTAPMVP